MTVQSITLQTSDNDIVVNDKLGSISFAASNESDGSVSTLIGAAIDAVAEGTFSNTSNPTSLVFSTAVNGTATSKLKISNSGHFLPQLTDTYDIGASNAMFRNGHFGQVNADNLRMDVNTISSTNTNGNIILSPTGTGKVGIRSSNPYSVLEVTPYNTTWGEGIVINPASSNYCGIFFRANGTSGSNTSGSWTLGKGNDDSLYIAKNGLALAPLNFTPNGTTTLNYETTVSQSLSVGSNLTIVNNFVTSGSGVIGKTTKLDGNTYSNAGVSSSGSVVSFNHPDGSGALVYDTIIPNQLALTRSENGGTIYNLAVEGLANRDISPKDTLWNVDGWSNISNVKSRSYSSLTTTLNGAVGNLIVDAELIMKHVPSDRYWKVKFSSWTPSGGGGGFAYTRQELYFSALINDNLYISDSGTARIGIGTNSPSYQLHVIGTGNFSQNLLVNGTGVSISGHTHTTSSITDFNSSVSGLLNKSCSFFTATHNQPPSSAFATLDTRNSIPVLEFDAATNESAVFMGVLPSNAVLSSGLIADLWWMADTATSGNVVWSVQFESQGTDNDSDSFDVATSGTATANGTSGIETETAITCTAIDSLTAGKRYRLKVNRVATDASDTMTGDAQLIGVEVRMV